MDDHKRYHIYAKGQRIYNFLAEKEFRETWDMIHKFLSISGELNANDITYEELTNIDNV